MLKSQLVLSKDHLSRWLTIILTVSNFFSRATLRAIGRTGNYRTHAVWLKVFAFSKNSTVEALYLLTWHHAG